MKKRRIKNRTESEGRSSSSFLWLALALAAAFFFFYRKTDSVPRLAAKVDAPQTVKEQKIVVNAAPLAKAKPELIKKTQERMAQAKSQMLARAALDLRTLDLDSLGTIGLKVKVIARPQRCLKGDLELILESLQKKASKLLLSVESLAGGSAGYSKELDPASFQTGTIASFTIPYQEFQAGMGLFICRDSNHSERCRDKTAYTAKDLATLYFSRFAEGKESKDPIFYYQMLIGANSKIEIPGSNSYSDSKEKFLAEYLTGNGLKPQNAEKQAFFTNTLHATLAPVPVAIEGKMLTISLPYDDGSCRVLRKK